MATITFYTLYDYNNGDLIEINVDLDEFDCFEEYQEHLHERMEEITKEKDDDIKREELIVANAEEIPARFVDEYQLDSEYFDYKDELERSHQSEDVFEAGIDMGIPLSEIGSKYFGYFEDEKTFGLYLVENGYIEIPDHLSNYIDYEAIGIDWLQSFSHHDGYYFYQ